MWIEFWAGVIGIITNNFYGFLLCQIFNIFILCPFANTNSNRVIPRLEKCYSMENSFRDYVKNWKVETRMRKYLELFEADA